MSEHTTHLHNCKNFVPTALYMIQFSCQGIRQEIVVFKNQHSVPTFFEPHDQMIIFFPFETNL